MKKHTKTYLDFFGYTEEDFISCEICEGRAVDIHHIDARGMGGNPKGDKDEIENLMAVCRHCHDTFGDLKEFKYYLKEIHKIHMDNVP